MAIMTTSMLLAGCGKSKDKDETTTETTEATSEEASTQDNQTGADFDFSSYVTYNTTKDKIEIDALSDSYQWEIYTYEAENIEVQTNEDAPHLYYTITPVKKTDFPIYVDLFGNGATERIAVTFEITVTDGLEIECSVTEELIPIYDDEPPVGDVIDMDLDMITQNVIGNFAEEDVPNSLQTLMLDYTDKDAMMFNLGVESLDGVDGIAITESMMSSTAFSLVVLRFTDADSAAASVDVLKDNAQTRKWVCVEPETVKVKVHSETYVIFLMGTNSQAAAVDKVQ